MDLNGVCLEIFSVERNPRFHQNLFSHSWSESCEDSHTDRQKFPAPYVFISFTMCKMHRNNNSAVSHLYHHGKVR
jgi:hypothetical protein